MIQRIIFYFILFFTIFSNRALAQCTPDSTVKSTGFFPDTLRRAKVWTPYSQTITILIPRDTTAVIGGNKFAVKLDSIVATGVYGLPAGFSYTCQNPNCAFVWNESRCVLLHGTTNQAGIFPLIIPVVAYAKLGATGLARADTVRRFSIIVDGAGSTPRLTTNTVGELNVFPNPGSGIIQVSHSRITNPNQVEIFNLSGQKMECKIRFYNGLWELDTRNWVPGVFVISVLGNSKILTVLPH